MNKLVVGEIQMATEVATGEYNFDIKAGATFTRFLKVNLPKVNPLDQNEVAKPFPLTGYVGRAQLRRAASSAKHYDFDVTIISDGLVKLHMSDEYTSTIQCGDLITDIKSKYKWALELESPDGDVIRPLDGIVRVSAELVK